MRQGRKVVGGPFPPVPRLPTPPREALKLHNTHL